MKITNVIDYDVINYKKPSMFIGTDKCMGKCDNCQNAHLIGKGYDIEVSNLIKIYKENPLTEAVVIGGLEPFDSFWDLFNFILKFRQEFDDDIVIYTGYYPHEISDYILYLQRFKNIIVKFGRYLEGEECRFDTVLGVKLASRNQYAKRIS